MKPTDEQNNAVALALTGHSLKIKAFAGAGKTTALKGIALAKPARESGLYLAFNNAIAKEAGSKFPTSVSCKTAHAMAFQGLGFRYAERLNKRLTGKQVAEYLGLKDRAVGELRASSFGALILSALTKFCQSGDSEATASHVHSDNLEPAEKEVIANYANQLFVQIGNINCPLPITHDLYLKAWAMQNPVIPVNYILFDEAQDANGVMLQIMENQKAQIIYVGDEYQQIYSWRGAVNAMRLIPTIHECQLSQSFRFGQPIADVANKILNEYLNANVNIKGFEQIESKIEYCEKPNVILSRTNAKLLALAFRYLSASQKPHIAGGIKDLLSLVYGARDLRQSGSSQHPDLAGFGSWGELADFADTKPGQEFKQLVTLVKAYGVETLISNLDTIEAIPEEQADIVLSTAHKSKGREWHSVCLEDDFRYENGEYDCNSEEYNLLYVAATRAQNVLDASRCKAVQNVLAETPCEEEEASPLQEEVAQALEPEPSWPDVLTAPTAKDVNNFRLMNRMSIKDFARFAWITERQVRLIENGKSKMDALRWLCVNKKIKENN